jgi:hypothetical protein
VRNRLFSLIVAIAGSATLTFAQDLEKKSTTKITVEGGKELTLTGCVERSAQGEYILTRAAGKDGALGTYTLVSDHEDVDFDERVGHRVEVKGKAADKGTGRLKVETKTEVDSGSREKSKTESKSEVKGDLKGLPFLGVKSIRTLATVCP